MTKIGCGTSARNWRARQQLEVVADEELPEARKKRFDGFRLIAQSAALGGELCLALDKITPGLVISSKRDRTAARARVAHRH